MILIIGLSLSLIAIGVLFYLGYYQKNQIQKKCNKLETSLLSLQKEFTAYQLDQARKYNKLDTDNKIKFDRINKTIKNHSKRMDNMNTSLPSIIGQVVGQIEFAQDIINRK